MNTGSLEAVFEAGRLALLVIDLQVDFASPAGLYARQGVDIEPVRRIVEPTAELMRACLRRGVPTIASQFTIVADSRGRPLIGSALLAARPFLAKDGFRPGTPGHALITDLPAPDFLVEKPTFSAFYASRLDFVLGHLGVQHLMICGVGTNGAVESTARDAQLRDLGLTLVIDCTAGFRADLHELSIKSMATLAGTTESGAVMVAISEAREHQ
jgi:nicotinamidase-related amidase